MIETPSPIGALMVESAAKGKKKTSGSHTATAPCGCEVTISWFSENSHRVGTKRCFRHPVRKVS